MSSNVKRLGDDIDFSSSRAPSQSLVSSLDDRMKFWARDPRLLLLPFWSFSAGSWDIFSARPSFECVDEYILIRSPTVPLDTMSNIVGCCCCCGGCRFCCRCCSGVTVDVL